MFNIKRISLIALVLLIVGITGSVFTFKSAYHFEDITKREMVNGEAIKNINITTNHAKIEVLPANDSEITAELFTRNDKIQLLTKVVDDTLMIQVKDKQGKFVNFGIFYTGATLTVYVPEKMYDSLQVEADNGWIIVDKVQANHVDVETDNGRIELENINSTTIKAKSDNGKIILNHVDGEISGRTDNGSIELITQDLDRLIHLETDNGKINIQTAKEPTNVTFDARVDNGIIRIFGKKDWDAVIGNGENIIKLKTNNGSITVTK